MNTKNIVGEKVVKDLFFYLTEAQFAQKGKEAAVLRREIDKLTFELDETKKKYQYKIKSYETDLDEVLRTINRGAEVRSVECIKIDNFYLKRVEYWFNGQMMDSREMTEQEKQMKLDLEKEAEQTCA